jgi:hypothetical protein
MILAFLAVAILIVSRVECRVRRVTALAERKN